MGRHRAERAGYSRLEISDHESSGRRFCYRCQAWHPVGAFGVDNRRFDRLTTSCRRSLNAIRQTHRETSELFPTIEVALKASNMGED